MKDSSDRYLEKTLFQAKKFGLHTHVIQQLESELNQRIEKNKTLK